MPRWMLAALTMAPALLSSPARAESIYSSNNQWWTDRNGNHYNFKPDTVGQPRFHRAPKTSYKLIAPGRWIIIVR